MNTFIQIIFQLPFFICLLSAVDLLFRWKKNTRPQNIWIFCALLLSVFCFIASYYVQGVKDYTLYYRMDYLYIWSGLLLFPLLFFYFKTLLDKKGFDWKCYLFLLPGVLLSGALTVLYIIMGKENAVSYLRELVETGGSLYIHTDPIFKMHCFLNTIVYDALVLLQLIIILIYATVQLLRYKRRLDDIFSDREGKSLTQHWGVLTGLYAFFVYALLVTVGGYNSYIQYSSFLVFLYILLSSILYYTCYHVAQANYTAEELEHDILEIDREAPPMNLSENQTKSYYKILPDFIQVIEREQVFLRKNLRVSDLATMLHTNRTYISQLLNEEYQCSFFDFINQKRIQYAQELMKLHPEYTQERLAEECGFSQASSFSRAFKQYTGQTFREWHRNIILMERPIP